MDSIEVMDFIPTNQFKSFKEPLSLGEKLGLRINIVNSKKGDTLRYTFKSKNKLLFSFKMNGQIFEVKPCLWNIEGYSKQFENAHEGIKTVITNAHECSDCSDRCGKGAKFKLGDKSFYKCIIRGFAYKNPSDIELENLIELILLESDMREEK